MARTKETLHQAPLLHNNHLDTKQFPSHIKRTGQVQRGRDQLFQMTMTTLKVAKDVNTNHQDKNLVSIELTRVKLSL